MKRYIFILAAVLALCFAIPAVAGPPGELPTLEALGPVVGAYVPLEAAVASMPARATTFDSTREAVIASIGVLAVVSTLAYLMRGVALLFCANIARVFSERMGRLGNARASEWV